MNRLKVKVLLGMALATVSAVAGPNRDAEFFIDCATASPGIDSVGTCLKDSTFTAAVAVRGAHKLYDYQCYMVYDTAQLRFVSAIKGSDACPNFLEGSGGSVFFTGKRSVTDSTRILVAASLTGDDTSQCVDGSGALALVTFRKRTADTTRLTLKGVIVEDCALTSDSACPVHGATIYPATIAIRWKGLSRASERKMEYAHDMVRLYLPAKATDCRADVFDITGRRVVRFAAAAGMMEADMKAASPGMYIITVVQDAHVSSYPIIIKK